MPTKTQLYDGLKTAFSRTQAGRLGLGTLSTSDVRFLLAKKSEPTGNKSSMTHNDTVHLSWPVVKNSSAQSDQSSLSA